MSEGVEWQQDCVSAHPGRKGSRESERDRTGRRKGVPDQLRAWLIVHRFPVLKSSFAGDSLHTGKFVFRLFAANLVAFTLGHMTSLLPSTVRLDEQTRVCVGPP